MTDIPAKSLHILVVDDEPMVRNSLQMVLQREGYQVETAQSGHEALEKFAARNFAAVLTDFAMPGMNGHQLASMIKAQNPGQPIVLVSAHVNSSVRIEDLPNIDALLAKPFFLEDLRKVVADVISKAALAKAT
jgi:two-component system capsular synthesis sensor histidine kinase RcsC